MATFRTSSETRAGWYAPSMPSSSRPGTLCTCPEPSLLLHPDLTRLWTRLAHRAGVTHATSSLAKSSLFAGSASILAGLSAAFRTGSAHALERGALIQDVTALHVVVGRTAPFADAPRVGVSAQVAALRRLLLGGEPRDTETGYWFGKAAEVRLRSLF